MKKNTNKQPAFNENEFIKVAKAALRANNAVANSEDINELQRNKKAAHESIKKMDQLTNRL